MIRVIVRLLVAALILNATWRLGSAYASFYKFRDEVTEATKFIGNKGDEALQAQVLELASQHDIPLAEDGFTINHKADHTFVDGAYRQSIELVPTVAYEHSFEFHIDAYVVGSLRPGGTSPRR